MATKQEYIKAINKKFEDRLEKASKPEKEGPAGTGPDMESDSSDVSTTER